MTEREYQRELIPRIKEMFPGCVVLKNDSGYQQGMLDWTILYGPFWATLEIKASLTSAMQPNQEYFIEQLDKMGFAAKICPENEAEVLRALQQAFEDSRRACVFES
jgi:hypothetical protein